MYDDKEVYMGIKIIKVDNSCRVCRSLATYHIIIKESTIGAKEDNIFFCEGCINGLAQSIEVALTSKKILR